MYRAWADNDEDAVILAGENACSAEAGSRDGLLCLCARDDFMSEQGGLDKRVVLRNSVNKNRRRK